MAPAFDRSAAERRPSGAAKLISGDSYILALTRYIHLNPIKTASRRGKSTEKVLRDLKAFPWSSYHGYCRGKETVERVDYRCLKLVGGATAGSNRRGYRRYVESCLQSPDDEFRAAQKVSRYEIGGERFVEKVESDLRDVRENKGVYGDIAWPEGRHVAMREIAQAVADDYGLEVGELRGRSLATSFCDSLLKTLARDWMLFWMRFSGHWHIASDMKEEVEMALPEASRNYKNVSGHN